MRFLVTVPANAESEAGVLPDQKILAEMANYNEQLAKAGVLLSGEGLQPTSKGARITFAAPGKTTVVDGPFTESKELIAGFWIIQARSKEEAVEWIKRAPFGGGVTLEIRPIFEPDDFGAEYTPEIRAQESRAFKQAAKNANQLGAP